ncbi:hypothetical protein Hanom_Chr07g00679881 [Helianthus anomalus]
MLACKYEPSHLLHTYTPLQISPQILYETPHETLHHPNAQAHLHHHLLLPNCVGFLPNLLPRVPIENSRGMFLDLIMFGNDDNRMRLIYTRVSKV